MKVTLILTRYSLDISQICFSTVVFVCAAFVDTFLPRLVSANNSWTNTVECLEDIDTLHSCNLFDRSFALFTRHAFITLETR